MKRKNVLFATIFALCLSLSMPSMAISEEPVPKTQAEMSLEAQRLTSRINEIKEMDKSQMTRQEKRALRKEVKALNSNLRDIGGGVYLSAGAIIIIALLLILLL